MLKINVRHSIHDRKENDRISPYFMPGDNSKATSTINHMQKSITLPGLKKETIYIIFESLGIMETNCPVY